MADYNVIVIGAGPAGYVAAIRCSQLGMKTVCVDKWLNSENQASLGGTCLNVGCIPSKALLDSSHHYSFMQKQAATHGIKCDNVTIDIKTMQTRKAEVVETLTKGIAGLFKKNKVTSITGTAKLAANKQVIITEPDGKQQTISGDNIIIATGSTPVQIPIAKFDNKFILDSTGALAIDKVPERLGVIGAGAIGLELGSVWSRLGSQVTVLEALPDFLAMADRKIATLAQRELKKQGLAINLNAQVTSATVADDEVTVSYSEQQLVVDKLIVAVGRKPHTDNLDANEAGIQMDERGFIQVDKQCQTAIAGIYAIGDVIGGAMLAHKGSEEGVMVAELIAGQKSKMSYATIPFVIYTHPEIAWVGKTEQQLKSAKIEYKTGQFPFAASGRARASGDTSGMVRIFADAKTDSILGVHIFGNNASELITEAVVAMELEASAEDLARTIHAHPTLAEAVHEAALGVDGRTIHA
ncbi:dihydrolipoyl dehydrogenase [Candidatus Halobeggiatoa sp. HSG11]|nr:dihydrolipoyl dehydrogenase [Candidatus Halobeggiatoa sp. HSG11]